MRLGRGMDLERLGLKPTSLHFVPPFIRGAKHLLLLRPVFECQAKSWAGWLRLGQRKTESKSNQPFDAASPGRSEFIRSELKSAR
jgi:hypothetical protein